MENKPLPEEAATSNDQVQNTKSPPVPSSKRPTEKFITDNAAAISELLKLRAAYAAGARKIAIIPSTRDEYSHLQGELESIYNKLIAVRDSLDVPLFSIPPNQAARDKIVARVTSKRKKAAAPTENNTSDNTSNVPKSLVKRETRKRATVDEDGFRLPPKKQTAIILMEVEEIEFDTEQAAAAPRVKITPFFIRPNPDWTDLMVFAHSLAPTLQSKLSGHFLRYTVQSEEEYRKLATYFRHEQIAFKSFMLQSETPLKLILRGLPTSTELEAVKKEIESEGSKIHNISRLTKFQSKAPMPLIYIQLINDLNANSIYNYVDMFGIRVAFEPVRGNSTRVQLRPNAHSLTFNFNVQSLSICFWNANGLQPKICEVRDFVSEQNPDLLLVQETKLQPGLDPLIANYRLHKDDRNNFPRSLIDGGTAIYCKNNYDHNRVPLPTLQYMDATAIEIKFNNFPPIRIVSAYARNTPENNRKFPDKDSLKILNSGQNIIIAGDLNAAHRTWSNARSNAFGYALRKIVNNKSNVRIVAPHTPTHINSSSRPGARDSIIDLAVLKNIPFNHDIRVIDDLESDHLPVILTLYTGSALIKIPDQLSTNWEKFKFLLNNKPLPIPPSSSNDDLEIAIRRLGENISEALIEASKPKFKQPNSPPKLKLKFATEIVFGNFGNVPEILQ
ncbi:probable RNA-directed DNA polymerase from transposon X-element [Trichonephila clavipes]|nr:probable RNA-directed DNA polymerase from transposon X-element [Trichonephila clavipes]